MRRVVTKHRYLRSCKWPVLSYLLWGFFRHHHPLHHYHPTITFSSLSPSTMSLANNSSPQLYWPRGGNWPLISTYSPLLICLILQLSLICTTLPQAVYRFTQFFCPFSKILQKTQFYLHFDYYIGGSSRVTTGAFHLSENVGWLDVFDYLTRWDWGTTIMALLHLLHSTARLRISW